MWANFFIHTQLLYENKKLLCAWSFNKTMVWIGVIKVTSFVTFKNVCTPEERLTSEFFHECQYDFLSSHWKSKCVFLCKSALVPSMAKGFPTVSSLQSASIETSKSNKALSMMNASREGGSVLHHRHTNTHTQTWERCLQTLRQIYLHIFLLPLESAGTWYGLGTTCQLATCHSNRGWD